MPLAKYVPPTITDKLAVDTQAAQVAIQSAQAPKSISGKEAEKLSAQVETAKTVEPKAAYTGRKSSTDDDKMSKADWAAKDRRIGRAGLYQAALQSPGLMQFAPTLEDYWALVKKTAELGLDFVNEAESK